MPRWPSLSPRPVGPFPPRDTNPRTFRRSSTRLHPVGVPSLLATHCPMSLSRHPSPRRGSVAASEGGFSSSSGETAAEEGAHAQHHTATPAESGSEHTHTAPERCKSPLSRAVRKLGRQLLTNKQHALARCSPHYFALVSRALARCRSRKRTAHESRRSGNRASTARPCSDSSWSEFAPERTASLELLGPDSR